MTLTFGDSRLPERYWKKVRIDDSGCWLWTAATYRKGYGVIGRGGRKDGTISAHKWMCLTAHGDQPADKRLVLHSCDTPPCVNPQHLAWGTAKQNSEQMVQRGRNHRTAHCPQGHEYTSENTYAHGGCKTCARARARIQAEKKRSLRK